MFREIEYFILKCVKKKEINLIDLYFSKIFDYNSFESDIIMMFTMLISLTSKIHVCLPLSKIFSRSIFSNYVLSFLDYFFSKYLSLNNCIDILFKWNILSKYYYSIITPLIFYNNCIYLYKFWVHEEYVVNYINLNFFKKDNNYINNKKIFKYFKKYNLNIYQKISIMGSIVNKFSIISGGPGTGKTTLISMLILILYKIFKYKNNSYIKIISFTGKSSSNITFSLKKNFGYLNINSSFRKILPYKSITIHKFLGFNYNKNIINNNIINTDILIIDESSMIDISLAFYLFSSIKYVKKIIFLGDSNQIDSIEPGSFFNVICNLYVNFYNLQYKIFKKIFLKYSVFKKKYNIYLSYINNVTFLKKNYRLDKNIYLYKFTNFVKLGYVKSIDNFLYKNNFQNNFNFYDSDKYDLNFLLNFCIKYYTKYINFVNFKFDLNKIWNKFNKFQIISVVKKTFYGVHYLNRYINYFFLKYNLVKNITYFPNLNCYHYMGEPFIITKNNNDLKLSNGDLGFFIFFKKKIKLLFLDFNKNNRYVYNIHLSNLNSTWVITVHKSQGSEYNHILLIIPNYFSYLLNRELIYTAITRAKNKVTIYANKNIFLSSLEKKKKNFSNIVNKLLI